MADYEKILTELTKKFFIDNQCKTVFKSTRMRALAFVHMRLDDCSKPMLTQFAQLTV